MNRKLAVIALTVCALTIASFAARGAGTNATEEATIRKIIAAQEAGGRLPYLPDRIFWAGPYKRPIVGDEKPEPFPGPRAVSNRVPGSEKTKTDVIRIVVSNSRDLAYEYSEEVEDFDLKSGEHVHSHQRGLLTVWQKENGQWKIAAEFIRPYDAPFAPSTDEPGSK